MEVLWDLDTEAMETARGSRHRRRSARRRPGVDPAYVRGLVDLVLERVNGTPAADRPALDRARPLVRRVPPGLLRERRASASSPRSPGSRRERRRASAVRWHPRQRARARAGAAGRRRSSAPSSSSSSPRATARRPRSPPRRHRRLRDGAARRAARGRGGCRRPLVQGPPDRAGRRARRSRRSRSAETLATRCARATASPLDDLPAGCAGRYRLAAPPRPAAGTSPGPRRRRHPRQRRHPARPGRQSAGSTIVDLDAVVLAAAGLDRLGRLDAVTEFLGIDGWPTAPAQGALAIEVARRRREVGRRS